MKQEFFKWLRDTKNAEIEGYNETLEYVFEWLQEKSCAGENDVLHGVIKHAWIFTGTNELKHPVQLYISADDRETAIATFETDYPQYKWFATTECEHAL